MIPEIVYWMLLGVFVPLAYISGLARGRYDYTQRVKAKHGQCRCGHGVHLHRDNGKGKCSRRNSYDIRCSCLRYTPNPLELEEKGV